ncbi:MAG: heparan-alpha-glucosaminide N-acetyltransferase domain-containing protein [Flavobacteriales bacterium]
MSSSRINSLDLLRGVVMVVMALDHVRDFFHHGLLFGADPTDMATTTPVLFFTRWITHFCAPVFVFLAGTSAFLYGRTRTKAQLSRFLWTRGLWMIFVEVIIVAFGWQFDPRFTFTMLAVFWAIGVSMLALALLVRLPYRAVLFIGLAIVLLHNLLDHVPVPQGGVVGTLFDALHRGGEVHLGVGRVIVFAYPVLPWIGTMALGYCLGRLFTSEVSSAQRKRALLWLGSGAIMLFIALRALNVYGDFAPWVDQPTNVYDLLSFLNVWKYPPSLLYLCMTLGPALLFLAWAEGRELGWSKYFVVFGRVPFFYYMLHIYLIHALATVAMVMQGQPWSETILTATIDVKNYADNGFPLGVVYAVWASVVFVLYFPCRWYARYRATHKEKWWLSYF